MNLFKAFGKGFSKENDIRFQRLANYKDGQFQNEHFTPQLTEGHSMLGVMLEFFKRNKYRVPHSPIPSIKSDLLHLNPKENVLVWFGHSSYFLQLDGKTFLVDPVFSGSASPFKSMIKAFDGSNIFQVLDLPYIDFLFISHDHWDHLDFETVEKLKDKTGCVICPLGVASHLEYWGWNKEKIIEHNWNESESIGDGFKVSFCPGRHFSGRGLKRNISLWTSFVLKTPNFQLFLGGDSGYDAHFKEIGEKFESFDLAILECGQYDKRWSYIHMAPEETMQAAKDLHAKFLLPVHNSKFALANHAWFEPLDQISTIAENENFPIMTPMIGEVVDMMKLSSYNNKWWLNVKD
ncbi:MAG: MBL fold metallo-hydrolase [Pseudopedobacter saltans]|uniref:MBL fold metallo-hydrolase n=1 Tax=Pseudopedobacter saltans TaxID=151895 RepID=A0A2W5EHH7_9SPHI|nr:MAG: MBL fold metallo-hydrolase [Pseudopedobacter saltans]